MKVAIVSDAWSPQRNGVVTTLVDLTRWLARAGHGIVVVEPSDEHVAHAALTNAVPRPDPNQK